MDAAGGVGQPGGAPTAQPAPAAPSLESLQVELAKKAEREKFLEGELGRVIRQRDDWKVKARGGASEEPSTTQGEPAPRAAADPKDPVEKRIAELEERAAEADARARKATLTAAWKDAKGRHLSDAVLWGPVLAEMKGPDGRPLELTEAIAALGRQRPELFEDPRSSPGGSPTRAGSPDGSTPYDQWRRMKAAGDPGASRFYASNAAAILQELTRRGGAA